MNNFVNHSILFFGTSEFALPALEALVQNSYRVVGVVTRPDERAGIKQILTPSPVKIVAERHGIAVYQPEKLDVRDFADKIPHADLFIVAAYGKIIPKAILDVPRFGALNIHPSLLPRWRGPAPIQYAILNGDTETGVTIMKMDELMDHGSILAVRGLEISNFQIQISKTSYQELHGRLAKLGAELLIETISRWLHNEITPSPQDDAKATYSKILTREDGRIDWQKPAEEIERMVRAFNPWPGTWTVWSMDAGDRRIRIEAAEAAEDAAAGGASGLVWQNKTRPLLIQSGRGSVAIKKLGIEGKKIVDADSFLRGYPQVIGASFT